MTRVLGLGDNTIDTYVDAGVQYPGGNSVNVAAMMARLGADSGYLGCVGDDEGGQLLLESLAAEGVDLTRTRTRQGTNARVFVSHVDRDRTFFGATPGVRTDYRWEEADFSYIASFDHVHACIDSAVEEELPRIAATNPSISFDGATKWSLGYLFRVLPHVRYLFLSASHLSESEAVEFANYCLAAGPSVVVLTRGSAGALGVSKDGAMLQPALPANVVDTLGAGDGFISGFLTSALAGTPFKEAMLRGAEYAAKVCGWHGGFGHGAPWRGDPDKTRAMYAK